MSLKRFLLSMIMLAKLLPSTVFCSVALSDGNDGSNPELIEQQQLNQTLSQYLLALQSQLTERQAQSSEADTTAAQQALILELQQEFERTQQSASAIETQRATLAGKLAVLRETVATRPQQQRPKSGRQEAETDAQLAQTQAALQQAITKTQDLDRVVAENTALIQQISVLQANVESEQQYLELTEDDADESLQRWHEALDKIDDDIQAKTAALRDLEQQLTACGLPGQQDDPLKISQLTSTRDALAAAAQKLSTQVDNAYVAQQSIVDLEQLNAGLRQQLTADPKQNLLRQINAAKSQLDKLRASTRKTDQTNVAEQLQKQTLSRKLTAQEAENRDLAAKQQTLRQQINLLQMQLNMEVQVQKAPTQTTASPELQQQQAMLQAELAAAQNNVSAMKERLQQATLSASSLNLFSQYQVEAESRREKAAALEVNIAALREQSLQAQAVQAVMTAKQQELESVMQATKNAEALLAKTGEQAAVAAELQATFRNLKTQLEHYRTKTASAQQELERLKATESQLNALQQRMATANSELKYFQVKIEELNKGCVLADAPISTATTTASSLTRNAAAPKLRISQSAGSSDLQDADDEDKTAQKEPDSYPSRRPILRPSGGQKPSGHVQFEDLAPRPDGRGGGNGAGVVLDDADVILEDMLDEPAVSIRMFGATNIEDIEPPLVLIGDNYGNLVSPPTATTALPLETMALERGS